MGELPTVNSFDIHPNLSQYTIKRITVFGNEVTEQIAPTGTPIINFSGLESDASYTIKAYAKEKDSCDYIFIVCIDRIGGVNSRKLLVLKNINDCPVYNKLRDIHEQKIPNKIFTFKKVRNLLSNNYSLVIGEVTPWNVLEY